MLMNDKQVAVNEVILSLREAADHYLNAAQVLADRPVAEGFEARGRACSDAAAGLDKHIRRLGELPRRPDPERETLDQILTRLGAGIAGDESSRYARLLQHKEAAIEKTADEALRQPLAEDTLAAMERIRAEAHDHRARLGEQVPE